MAKPKRRTKTAPAKAKAAKRPAAVKRAPAKAGGPAVAAGSQGQAGTQARAGAAACCRAWGTSTSATSSTSTSTKSRKTPLLTQKEEIALARKVRAGDQEAMQELVKRNLRFVISVAKKYQNRGLPLTDLIGEGNVGLLTAARKFDPDQGVKFISYAVWWIRQAILAALARQGRTVRVPLEPHRRSLPHRAHRRDTCGRRCAASRRPRRSPTPRSCRSRWCSRWRP